MLDSPTRQRRASLPTNGISPRENIDGLTGLRFLAAFTIAFGHSLPVTAWILHQVTAIGMPLFFTLSGFVIHYVYADAFASERWSRAAGRFAAARFSRLYPLYIVLLLLSLIATPMGAELLAQGRYVLLLSYVFVFSSWWPAMIDGKLPVQWYYGLSWSIPTEIFFYICYAFFLFRIARIKSARSCLIALCAFCALAYGLFLALFLGRDQWEPFLVALQPGLLPRLPDFANSLYRWVLYISPYFQLLLFIGGCLACQLFMLLRRQPDAGKRFRAPLMAWAGGVGLILTWSAFCYAGQFNWLGTGVFSPLAFLVVLHLNFLLAPFCYLLMLGLALGPSSINRVLSAPAMVLLGEISYSIYLGHPLAQSFVSRAWAHLPGLARAILPEPTVVVVKLIAIVLLAFALYVTVEKPGKRWLRRMTLPSAGAH